MLERDAQNTGAALYPPAREKNLLLLRFAIRDRFRSKFGHNRAVCDRTKASRRLVEARLNRAFLTHWKSESGSIFEVPLQLPISDTLRMLQNSRKLIISGSNVREIFELLSKRPLKIEAMAVVLVRLQSREGHSLRGFQMRLLPVAARPRPGGYLAIYMKTTRRTLWISAVGANYQ